jgi:glycerol-3-phosphate dehydrogenase (NAD(P)+)
VSVQVGVVGAGSWGTTLADLLARNGHDVKLWAREPEVVESIRKDRVNAMFLADSRLQDGVDPREDIADVVTGAELVVSAVPSQHVREVGRHIAAAVGSACPTLVTVSKGLEPGTHHTMTHVLEELMPQCGVVALSGPSFAQEVYRGLPTAVVAAASDVVAAEKTQRVFSNSYFRVYTSPDALGVQLGGALKNVVAIAAGVLDGLDLGTNPRAALITRGLAETSRLGEELGADPHTFAGLAGMGDLILTATGALSRNRTLGIELGRGRALDEILAERHTVAEGISTARVAVELAEITGVELPIASEVEHVLFHAKSPHEALRDLMERELKAERWR